MQENNNNSLQPQQPAAAPLGVSPPVPPPASQPQPQPQPSQSPQLQPLQQPQSSPAAPVPPQPNPPPPATISQLVQQSQPPTPPLVTPVPVPAELSPQPLAPPSPAVPPPTPPTPPPVTQPPASPPPTQLVSAVPQSPFSTPDIDLRSEDTYKAVAQGTPESFAKPVEPQIVGEAPQPVVAEAKLPDPTSTIDSTQYTRIDKQLSSTGQEVDVSTVINPPKKPLKFGAAIVVVVIVLILGVVAFFTYSYISDNLLERSLSCTSRSNNNTSTSTPAYDAEMKVGFVGKNPRLVSVKYQFIYDSDLAAEDVSMSSATNMAKNLNKDYAYLVSETTMPVTNGNKTTLTVSYASTEFVNKLVGYDTSNESSEKVIGAVSDQLAELGYTCVKEEW